LKKDSVVNNQKVCAFLSYDQKDEHLVKQFLAHLAPLERHSAIEVLHKEKIQPGEPRQEAMREMLAKAQLVLLFVTPDFVVSASCYEQEMRQALERHKAGDACVIPILVRPTTHWTHLPFGSLQALPRNGKPITSWPQSRRDEAWVHVAEGITDTLQNFIGKPLYSNQSSNHVLDTAPSGLTFANISLDKGNPYWHEIEDLTNEESGKPFPPAITNALIPDPFHRPYSQHFHAHMLPPDPDRAQAQLAQLPREQRVTMEYIYAIGGLNENADPSFDVTLLNTMRRPIILTAIGIELVSMALVFALPGGGPRAYTVPIDASYTIDIPDVRKSLDRMKMQRVRSSYHYIPPVQMNKVLSIRLPDPICIPPRATFRYTLLLAHYEEHMPNSTLLCLWLQTHEGQERSHGLYLSSGDIWWEREAIKEITDLGRGK
jgi:hypothetical protein